MRTIVVGDIHGCYNELKTLIYSLIEKKIYNVKEDRLIFLGDYIDRGDDPRSVIRFIRTLQDENPNVIALMGNHEDMMIDYFKGNETSGWLWNGYENTIESYDGHEEDLKYDLQWMKGLPLYFEDDNFIYVHAGIDLNKKMEEQDSDTLLWTRFQFISSTKKYPKRVIFGHTPNVGNYYYTVNDNICLDSGAVYGGVLTALVIEDGEEKRVIQVKKGEKEMKSNNLIMVMAQAFYGNNTVTEIRENDLERFLLGYIDSKLELFEDDIPDKTILRIPNNDNLVIIYNKYEEEKAIEKGYNKILAEIPEDGIKLYSRCIACRMDENGELKSLESEDFDILEKYLVA